MLRQTLMVLGIGVIVAGFASAAHAQSTNPSSSDNRSTTLSGDSLRTVQGRTISDSQNIFNPGPQVSRSSSERIGTASKSPPVFTLDQQPVDVIFGDTLNSEKGPTSFPPPGEAGDTGRVKLMVPVGQ